MQCSCQNNTKSSFLIPLYAMHFTLYYIQFIYIDTFIVLLQAYFLKLCRNLADGDVSNWYCVVFKDFLHKCLSADIMFMVSAGRIFVVLHQSLILLSSRLHYSSFTGLTFYSLHYPSFYYFQMECTFSRFNSTHSFSSTPSASSNVRPLLSTYRLLPDGGYSRQTACRSLQLSSRRASLSPTRTQHLLASSFNRQWPRHSKAATHR